MALKSAPAREILDVVIDTLNLAGDGVGRYRGRTLLVPYTIPGERVRVRVGRTTSQGIATTLLEVLKPSVHRVEARCRHFGPAAGAGGGCGGCNWQHIAYPEQLRLKTALVDAVVRAAVSGAPASRPMLAGAPVDNPWSHRQKVHFVFAEGTRRADRRPGTLLMGHYARGSRRIVPVEECPVHDDRGNTLAFALRDAYRRAGVSGDTLKSVSIRAGAHTPEIMATLVVSDDRDKRVRAATRRVVDQQAPTAFHVNLHPRDDSFIFGRETRRISGSERMRDTVAGAAFLLSPTAFFQTNVLAAEVLVRLVLDAVPAGASVLDLYAGSGLFAIPLALAGHRVIAVEENREATADGDASLRLNRVPSERCLFVTRTVESALGSLRATDAAVLDPPREGCAPMVIERLFGRLAPATAIYISCNPEVLGSDLASIVSHGYRITRIQPVDMFPHTAHIETVVTLERR